MTKEDIKQKLSELSKLKDFEYPDEISSMTASFRTEVEPQSNKVFKYKITQKTTEC